MKIIRLIIVLFLSEITFFATAQRQRSEIWKDQPGTWFLNLGLGATHYMGDMDERGNLSHLQLGMALSAAAAYRFSDQFTFRAEAQLYYIRGTQQNTHLAYNNLSFHSLNPDLWVGLQMDFWHPSDRNHSIVPYGILGVGLTYLTPKTTYKGHTYSLAPLHTEGVDYNRLPVILRYGIGIPVLATERFHWHVEGVYAQVLSDYVDDVSTVYADQKDMTPITAALSDRRPEIGQAPNPTGAQRGNNGKRDGYFILSARISFVIITPQQRHYRRSRRG